MRTYRNAGKWLWKYDERGKARAYVGIYVKRGKLAKLPCRDCGALEVQAHHDDYSKPLDVIWLCRKCHNAIHMP